MELAEVGQTHAVLTKLAIRWDGRIDIVIDVEGPDIRMEWIGVEVAHHTDIVGAVRSLAQETEECRRLRQHLRDLNVATFC